MAKDVRAGLAIRVATDEIVTMRPPSRSNGGARWTMKYGARTFTAKRCSNRFLVMAPSGPAGVAAALLTRMSSGRPARPASTPAKSVSTSSSTPSSAPTANAVPLVRAIFASVPKCTMTTAPLAAGRAAIACPMLRDAPLTRAVLPVGSLMSTTPCRPALNTARTTASRDAAHDSGACGTAVHRARIRRHDRDRRRQSRGCVAHDRVPALPHEGRPCARRPERSARRRADQRVVRRAAPGRPHRSRRRPVAAAETTWRRTSGSCSPVSGS